MKFGFHKRHFDYLWLKGRKRESIEQRNDEKIKNRTRRKASKLLPIVPPWFWFSPNWSTRYLHAMIVTIPSNYCQASSCKNNTCLIFFRQNWAKIKKQNRQCRISNQFWRLSEYTSMRNLRLFLLCVLKNCLPNPQFETLHYVQITVNMWKSTDHDQNIISSTGEQNTLAYQISGHTFHAFCRKHTETSPGERTDGRTTQIYKWIPGTWVGWEGDQCVLPEIALHLVYGMYRELYPHKTVGCDYTCMP